MSDIESFVSIQSTQEIDYTGAKTLKYHISKESKLKVSKMQPISNDRKDSMSRRDWLRTRGAVGIVGTGIRSVLRSMLLVVTIRG